MRIAWLETVRAATAQALTAPARRARHPNVTRSWGVAPRLTHVIEADDPI